MIIRSLNEADRLRLTLASLERQDADFEVVAVDDGSEDHTQEVLREAAGRLPLRTVRHERPRGRSAASNTGARIARGEVLLFMDGDVLAGPGLLARHIEVHEGGANRLGRGETFHLRSTRFLLDPETGSAMPGEEDRVSRASAEELDRMRVTRAQVLDDFAAIERRSLPSIYPGASPTRLYEAEMRALAQSPDCRTLWAASSGANFSVGREAFLGAGGLDERIDMNEHRELAYRLCARGGRMVPVAGGRSHHLTHRSGWRDPMADMEWERLFFEAHPDPAVKLLVVFWACLTPLVEQLPEPMRIRSLEELEAKAADPGLDVEAARRVVLQDRAIAAAPAV